MTSGARRMSESLRARPRIEALEERTAPAVFNVNSLADILNPPVGTVTLRSAIQAANNTPGGNTINLTLAGTYQLSIPGALVDNNTSGELAIFPSGGNLTIQNTSGGSISVDGGRLDRVFDINPQDVSLPPVVAMTFIGFGITNGLIDDPAAPDGVSASGGGIRVQGNISLTLTNMAIGNNVASADGGGIAMKSGSAFTLTLNNTSVGYNHAGDAGGGIETDGSGQLFINSGSLIYNNTCVNQGGGIWLNNVGAESATLKMTGTVMNSNFAQKGLGGAIGNAGNGGANLTSSTFEGNFSGTTGGALGDVNGQSGFGADKCLFQNNSSAGNGGAVQESGGTFSNCYFASNSSSASGGAIFDNGSELTVTGCTFYSNTAAIAGGAIELQITGISATASSIVDSTIHRNDALNSAGASGGGIDAPAAFTGTLSLVNDTIDANQATNGGGIFYAGTSGSAVTVANTIIAKNSAINGPDADNAAGTFTDQEGNVIGIAGLGSGNVGFGVPATQTGTVGTPLDPRLGSLVNNGGPTAGFGGAFTTPQSTVVPTEAPLPGSPALAHGLGGTTPALDERGYLVPASGPFDVGAYQSAAAPGDNSANQRYVNSLYMTLFNRNADAGSAGWVNLLNQGTPRSAVVAGLEASLEYRADVVIGFYQHLLKRQPDLAGLQVFVNALSAGATYEQVQEAIVSSPEYFQLHGSTNTGFVTGLYQDVLGRAPDSGGLANFTNALNSGASRISIALDLYSSGEYMANLVANDYRTYLGRSEDPTGAAAFLLALQSGATDQAVVAAILGSPEAFARRT